MLKHALSASGSFGIPIGIFFIITAMPLDKTMDLQSLDWVGVMLGGLLILGSVLGKFLPRPEIFLLHAAFFLAILLDTAVKIVAKQRSHYWVILGVVCVWFAQLEFRKYCKFRGVKPPPDAQEESGDAVPSRGAEEAETGPADPDP
jgi:hypothetical protein